MSLYLEQIRQLVLLQGVDDEMLAVEEELAEAPRAVEKLEQDFAAAEAQKARIEEKMSHLLDQERRVEDAIRDENDQIHKSKNKLMQVANSREYQAMSREMDNFERSVLSREDERAALREEIKTQTAVKEEIEANWNSVKERLEAAKAGLQARIDDARSRIAALEEQHNSIGASIPKPVLDRYEFIRSRLEHPVIVSVSEGICNGCHIAIPPQAFIDLQSGQKILNCPNCQRLIYWSEHFKDEKAETAQEAESETESGE
ncbi:MAG: hypothetical protein IKX79_06420 [Desulfovibrionaceae bacterium]|nr:hypothetical protein [Desulfovibrionaceae bacterium]